MPDHPADTADKPEDVATLRAALLAAEARIAALEQIIHSFQRARFGQSAERIDTAQLALTLGQDPPPPPANDPAVGSVNRPGFVGGSNFQIGWSRYEQNNEQILP